MADIQGKKNTLFIILGGIFICNAVLAELIGVKIFSFEESFGLPAAALNMPGGFILDFNLTAGVVIWPVVFITTDIINEYFGKEGVKKITFLTIGLIIYVFIVIALVTWLEPAQFWLDINNEDDKGNVFNMSFAFNKVFLQGLGIIIGSLVAFLIGQMLDVFVFQKLRKITGAGKIWLRATGSTLISQFVDSFVVLFIAFYIFGDPSWPLSQIVAVGIINYIYKFTVAIILTPVLYLGHNIIDNYLGQSVAHKMADQAARESESLF